MTDNEPGARLTGGSGFFRANDLPGVVRQFFSNERLVVSVVLVLLVVFSVSDYFEDRAGGADSAALFNDVSDTFLPLVLLIYIWRLSPLSLQRKTIRLESDLASKNADLQHWKARAASHLKGLSTSIDEQLNNWQLTRAEKEVAIMLLKGFSLRDLASMRGTSERTVRQQAACIYNKAGLQGRAELSAFFLEDLMLPVVD